MFKSGIIGQPSSAGKLFMGGLTGLGKQGLDDMMYRYYKGGEYPLGVYGNGVSDAISGAANISNNFLSQTHKAQSFQNVNNNPNLNTEHMPFLGKMFSQHQSDVISGRKYPMDILTSTKDIINHISNPKHKRLHQSKNSFAKIVHQGKRKTMPGGIAPNFQHNKRHKTVLNQRNLPDSVSMGEANMYGYRNQSAVMPTLTTPYSAEVHGRAKM